MEGMSCPLLPLYMRVFEAHPVSAEIYIWMGLWEGREGFGTQNLKKSDYDVNIFLFI